MDPATFQQAAPFPCPSCGGFSGKCYRCTVCGYDLAGDTTTAGRQK